MASYSASALTTIITQKFVIRESKSRQKNFPAAAEKTFFGERKASEAVFHVKKKNLISIPPIPHPTNVLNPHLPSRESSKVAVNGLQKKIVLLFPAWMQ